MHDPVTDHYRKLLARRYEWMLGGAEHQLERTRALAEELDLSPRASGRAVDLGGGPGFFAVALAERGFEVDIVDTSEFLLERARVHGADLPLTTHREDLVEFLARSTEPFELCACLGDTITHLASRAQVLRVCELIRDRLEPGGRLVISYRDSSAPVEGLDRFILVRADADRSFTCFLERTGDRLLVHDLVHEREGGAWTLHKSAYPKLILAQSWLRERLERLGFELVIDTTPSGLLRLVASLPATA